MIALGYYKVVSVFVWASPIPQPSSEEEHKMAEYDLIIRNGTIVDGTGGIPAYRGDVAVKNGMIAMISGRIRRPKRRTPPDASSRRGRSTCTTTTICS